MPDIVKLGPESFLTLYLTTETDIILRTEKGQRIVIDKIVPDEWIPMRIYDYERMLNENKRNIIVVDKDYLQQIDKEFKRFMKE